jgi:ubiquinone/menaquinone biosynthesis C-methylase UbiE
MKQSRTFSKFAESIDPPNPVIITARSRKRPDTPLSALNTGSPVLNVGSGSTKLADHVINLDLVFMGNVDVVANSSFLPFKDDTFSFVICQTVLEHVETPTRTAEEKCRVLRTKGTV